jgi:hypothetical protein
MRAMANLRYRVLPPQLLGLAKQAVLRSGYLVMEIIISGMPICWCFLGVFRFRSRCVCF